MGLIAKIPTALCLLATICLFVSAATYADNTDLLTSFETFRHSLFSKLVEPKPAESIIFSPFSIQTGLAMVRMGAAGKTAEEMDSKLGFTGQTPESVADNYHRILTKYEDSKILKIANKVYVMAGYELQDKFNEVLSKKFLSPAENINFGETEEAAKVMNTWVESKSNSLIKDLVHDSDLSRDTLLVLMNAIHFKGDWVKPFAASKTREEDFHTNGTHAIKVQMMSKNEYVPYHEFPELDAAVISMPYRNSDISMWVFLPNTRTGLSNLEEKLVNFNLASLAKEMKTEGLVVSLPKFKVEYEIELSYDLEKMGLGRLFRGADFSKMLKSPQPLAVSKVLHKAVIDVTELGTEAAAATAIIMEGRTAFMMKNSFKVDHPFYYVIATADFVPLFQGTFIGV